MKHILILITLALSVNSIAQTNKEIIDWLNNFEDRNSPERIMKGTFEDKVNLEYDTGYLIINSMAWQGSSVPPKKLRNIIRIADITKIEALKKVNNGKVIFDINICAKYGSIGILEKESGDRDFKPAKWEQGYFNRFGYCSAEFRLKFPIETANTEVERVYKAFRKLCENHGAYPKIGSLF